MANPIISHIDIHSHDDHSGQYLKNSSEIGMSNKKEQVDNLIYLGAFLCDSIEAFRDELEKVSKALNGDNKNIAAHIYKLRSYQQVLSVKDRYEEVAAILEEPKHG